MKKIIFCLIVISMCCVACTNSKTTETTPTGGEWCNVHCPYLFYSNCLYVYDEDSGHIEMEETEILNHYEGYEYVGNVSNTTKETYPKAELEATELGTDAKVYAKGEEIIIFYHDRIFEMKKMAGY